MKNLIVLIISMTFLVAFSLNAQSLSPTSKLVENDSILLWCSPDLEGITETWVEAYKKQFPEANIGIMHSESGDYQKLISVSGSIGIVSKEGLSTISDLAKWSLVVGRDVVVPVMNSENPFKDDISKTGISASEFAKVFSGTENEWGELLSNKELRQVNCYLLEDESVKSFQKSFLKSDINLPAKNYIQNKSEFLDKIKSDTYAIGFCKLSDITDNQNIIAGLSLIPIDANENNRLDYFENLYLNFNDFKRGIWVGKYPNELYSRIYTVATEKPIQDNELAFLEWMVTQGQQHLDENGYADLISNEVSSKIQSIYANERLLSDIQPKSEQGNLGLLILVISILLVGLSFLFIRFLIPRGKEFELDLTIDQQTFNEDLAEIPGGLFYDKTHTWAFMEKDGAVRVGIDDFMQHITGKITRVKMKDAGEYVKKGEVLLTIMQHGKKLNIYSPVSGIIKENNNNIYDNASLINSSPYNHGWIYRIESVNWVKEIKTFVMSERYSEWLKNELIRLKDFLAKAINIKESNTLVFALQDGGELKDKPLEGCDPEIWEEFQSGFIDTAKELSF